MAILRRGRVGAGDNFLSKKREVGRQASCVGEKEQDAFVRSVQEETSFVTEAEEDLSITKIKKFYFKPMTREEAVMQMNLLDHNFFAFRDLDNEGSFAVVYKRNDGGYGLIDDAE